MYVVAAVIVDRAGRVLLAQRPKGKHLQGLWEFPGGKLELGETPWQALMRELVEEIGIRIIDGTPYLHVPQQEDGRRWLLDVWMVRQWQGQPTPLEGQALQWAFPNDVDSTRLAPADRVVLHSLQLSTKD